MTERDSLLYLRAERARQVGTPDERREREQESARRFARLHTDGQCARGAFACAGGAYCVHALYAALAPEAMRAAVRYDYGVDPRRRSALYQRLMDTFVARHVPLTVARDCGVRTELLLFAGLDVRTLIANGYVLETIVEVLALDWPTLRELGGARDNRFFPDHVLRDAFGDSVLN